MVIKFVSLMKKKVFYIVYVINIKFVSFEIVKGDARGMFWIFLIKFSIYLYKFLC